MCVICVSGVGARQPNKQEITNMFTANYHGAGYMYCQDGHIVVRKGYDNLADYLEDLEKEHFTADDVVIYHFRIATQARRYQMTQPFPLTNDEDELQAWDSTAEFGVAHNGIIKLTSNGNPTLSDTALYIRDYLTPRIKTEQDIIDNLDEIADETAGSKVAILAGNGHYYLTGKWIYDEGLLYSNDSYETRYYRNFTFDR